MLSIIGFFTGGIGRWIVLAVVVAGAAAFARSHFINEGRQQVLAENQAAALKIIVQQGAITERVVNKYIKVAGATETVTQTVEKEIVRYAETNTSTCLDADWRRLHDSAALNAVPAPGQPPDGTSGAPDSATALETVTKNYARCNRTADRLDALQDWVRQQYAVTSTGRQPQP